MTFVLVVDRQCNIINPKIWRGIGQGYDEYVINLIKSNSYTWTLGITTSDEKIETEAYYQLDYLKNKNRIMNKENQPID